MTVEPGWPLAIALALLVLLAIAASLHGRLGLHRSMVVAAVRAMLQLAAVSTIIVFCLRNVWLAIVFSLVMFVIAVRTTCKRTGVHQRWMWTTVAMLSGLVPVLTIIFASGTTPLNGAAIVPVAGIIIGNMMTAHTLFGRRQFAQLRDNLPIWEAALSVGMVRRDAVRLVTEKTAPDAMVPNVDTTKTVGLVSLPGAFVGVLLGGGSAIQAGAAQVLVLIGIMAGQAVTIVVANRLMQAAKLLPDDLVEVIHP